MVRVRKVEITLKSFQEVKDYQKKLKEKEKKKNGKKNPTAESASAPRPDTQSASTKL